MQTCQIKERVQSLKGLDLHICDLLANFQKISFNVISKVSVKGMGDDEGEECNEDNDNIYYNDDDGEEEEKIS